MISVRGISLLFVFVLFAIGLLDFWVEIPNEQNACEMTYMYQLPQYIPIPLEAKVSANFANYSLYVYGEGEYAESLRRNRFDGSPVLFVPGNAGSHKQSRSLASVALVMSYADRAHHFNYFNLDYNEELSAFIGAKLLHQQRYLYHAIKKIVSLYKPKMPNVRIVLIGHSIGGILIKSLLTEKYFRDYLPHIALVVTLATPHKHTAIPYDNRVAQFYRESNQLFQAHRTTELADINVLSIGGSTADKIIRSDLIDLNSEYQYDLSILTTAINDVWAPADHLSIVWCRQLTVKLNQILFDLIDPKQRVFWNSSQRRQEVIDYHVRRRHFGRIFPSSPINEKINFLENNQWIEHNERLVRLNISKVLKPVNHMLMLQKKVSIVVHIQGTFKLDTISACRSRPAAGDQPIMCDDQVVVNLYRNMTLVPSTRHKQDNHMGHFEATDLLAAGYTHLVVRLTPTSTSSYYILIDRFTSHLRHVPVKLPSLWHTISNSFEEQTIFTKFISQDHTAYRLSLHGLDNVWMAYSLVMQTGSCYKDNNGLFIGYGRLVWANSNLDEYIRPFFPIKGGKHFFDLLPNQLASTSTTTTLRLSPATLFLYLEPKCAFELKVKFSPVYFSAQLLRHYFVLLVPTIVSTLFLVLAYQLSRGKAEYSIPSHELSEFKEKLVKHELSQNGNSGHLGTKCFIYPKAHEMMTGWVCLASIYSMIVCFQLITLWSLDKHHTLYGLSRSSLTNQLMSCSILFIFSYSIVYISWAVVYNLLGNISFLVASLKFNTFVNDKIQHHVRLVWHSTSLLLLLLVYFFCIPLTFYLQLLLFTILALNRFISAQKSEMRIGRTTSSSCIMSIYPTVYLLLLLPVSYYIPQTIDRLNSIWSSNLAWPTISPLSLMGLPKTLSFFSPESTQSFGIVMFYLIVYHLPPPSLATRLATNPIKRHHQKCLDLVSALLAFGNIFLGAQTFDHLTHFVLATLVAIVVLAALQAKNQPRKVSKLD